MTAAEITKLRTGLGITQQNASERLGISLRHYQRLEAGHSIPSPALGKLINLAMRVRPDI